MVMIAYTVYRFDCYSLVSCCIKLYNIQLYTCLQDVPFLSSYRVFWTFLFCVSIISHLPASCVILFILFDFFLIFVKCILKTNRITITYIITYRRSGKTIEDREAVSDNIILSVPSSTIQIIFIIIYNSNYGRPYNIKFFKVLNGLQEI